MRVNSDKHKEEITKKGGRKRRDVPENKWTFKKNCVGI